MLFPERPQYKNVLTGPNWPQAATVQERPDRTQLETSCEEVALPKKAAKPQGAAPTSVAVGTKAGQVIRLPITFWTY